MIHKEIGDKMLDDSIVKAKKGTEEDIGENEI